MVEVRVTLITAEINLVRHAERYRHFSTSVFISLLGVNMNTLDQMNIIIHTCFLPFSLLLLISRMLVAHQEIIGLWKCTHKKDEFFIAINLSSIFVTIF